MASAGCCSMHGHHHNLNPPYGFHGPVLVHPEASAGSRPPSHFVSIRNPPTVPSTDIFKPASHLTLRPHSKLSKPSPSYSDHCPTWAIAGIDTASIVGCLLRLSALANDSGMLPLRLRPRGSKVACNAGARCRASSDWHLRPHIFQHDEYNSHLR